jgi:hypothetical protein
MSIVTADAPQNHSTFSDNEILGEVQNRNIRNAPSVHRHDRLDRSPLTVNQALDDRLEIAWMVFEDTNLRQLLLGRRAGHYH